MIKKINFKHSLIFFNICIITSYLQYEIRYSDLYSTNLLILCLFLILTIGISHGSLDHIKGKKLIKLFKIKSMILFYASYIFIGFLTIFLWIIIPKIILSIFLLVAAYHFGKEDSNSAISKKNIFDNILLVLKGSVVISAPLLLHTQETIDVFMFINFDISSIFPKYDDLSFAEHKTLYILILLSFISNIILSLNQDIEYKFLMIMDFFSIIILNYWLSPILAFTIYFCFLHSIRHSFSLIFEINKNFKKGFILFVKKAIPLTLITAALYLISIIYLKYNYGLNETMYKVIFIGLASLTFPHILLEYLLEKNEK
tara:strand:+ start:613 stop:1554 length:942 start_codon:yes stop_codon:yes gene_type:complete